MGVAVLSPQDCLKDPSFSRQPLISPPPKTKSSRNPNPNSNPNSRRATGGQPNCRKPRSNNPFPPCRSAVPRPQPKKLVMGQVRILKRGQDLSKAAPAREADVKKNEIREDPDLGSLGLLGPAPESDRSQLGESSNKVALFYAGSAFFTSPPPSSVPLPAFFTKKSDHVGTDDATSGLRRLLRLDLQ